jgi:hypothetical protein
LRRGGAGEHEDAGADDRSDPERDQMPRSERSPQQPTISFSLELGERFLGKQSHVGL